MAGLGEFLAVIVLTVVVLVFSALAIAVVGVVIQAAIFVVAAVCMPFVMVWEWVQERLNI